MKAKTLLSVLGVFLAAGFLSGCNMTTPSQVKTGQIQLRQDVVTETLDAARPESGRVAAIAQNYQKNGSGPLRLTLSLLSGDPRHQVAAETQAHNWRREFAKSGVADIQVDYVPVGDAGYSGRAVISYMALAAHPPEDCRPLTGRDGGDTLGEVNEYSFGCESKAALSKMIADPRDLLGTSGTEAGGSRRHGAVVEKHEAGTPNEAFANEISASSLGQ